MTERRKPMDDFMKADFCDLIRNGHLRFDACRQLDVTVSMVQTAYRADPNFRSDLDEALLEATEPVENALYVSAKAGEPWATKMWLERRDKERWGEAPKQIQVTHEQVGPELLESVGGILAELAIRRAHAQAIETGGKLIEIPPTKAPYIYEPGQAPVFHSVATKEGQRALKKKALKQGEANGPGKDTALPPRPGATGEGPDRAVPE